MFKAVIVAALLSAAISVAQSSRASANDLTQLFSDAEIAQRLQFLDPANRMYFVIDKTGRDWICAINFDPKEVTYHGTETKDCSYNQTTRSFFGRWRGNSPIQSIEGKVSADKHLIFWRHFLDARVQFKDGRSENIKLRGAQFRLPNKAGCYYRPLTGYTITSVVLVDIAKTRDAKGYLERLARPRGWGVSDHESTFPQEHLTFKVSVGAFEGLQALELFSKDDRVICAEFFLDRGGPPPMNVTDITYGKVLDGRKAAHLTSDIHKWLQEFFDAGPVRITSVRQRSSSHYSVAIVAPSRAAKFDDNSSAWVRLEIDIGLGVGYSTKKQDLADLIMVSLLDVKRAKAPINRPEPPEELFVVLPYMAKESVTSWGKKMNRWNETFMTFLARRYDGVVEGFQ